jgi:tetratricopeptide (TPR) repeat protein
VRYVRLTLWPVHLSPWYSHPWFEGPPLSVAGVAAAIAIVVGVTALVVAGARRVPYATVGWLWYLGTLLPVLGLLYNGRQGMADRYAYIPHIGLFVALTWTLGDAWSWRSARIRVAGAVVAATLLLALGVLTWRQTSVWQDDRSFWAYTARTNRYSFIAHQALGAILQGEGRTHDAIAEYGRAAHLRPELAKVHVQFASLLARTGRFGAAAAQLRKAIAADPGAADAHMMLARVLIARRHPVGARRELEQALALRPDLADARQLLATLDGAPEGP